MEERDIRFLRQAFVIAQRAREHGNHPFGALLVSPDSNVLLEAENTVITESDCTGHAEMNLVRNASKRFDRALLLRCTLYASTEPCVMCAGAIFWSYISRLVYGLSSARLYELVGKSSTDPHPRLSCREVLAGGGSRVEVIGSALEAEAEEVHEGFWH